MKSLFRFLVILSFSTLSFYSWTHAAEGPLELPDIPTDATPATTKPEVKQKAHEATTEPTEKVAQTTESAAKEDIPEPKITESKEEELEQSEEKEKPPAEPDIEETKEIEPVVEIEPAEEFAEEAPLEEVPELEIEDVPAPMPELAPEEKQPATPTSTTRQLTLEEEQAPLMRGESESRQEWFSQTTEYTTKISALIDIINKKTNSSHESQRTIDTQLDTFYNKTNPELGVLQRDFQNIQRTLNQRDDRSPEAGKLKIMLNTLRKNIKQAELNIEEVATLERSLIEQLSLIDSRRDSATKSASQASKTKQQILSEQDEETAKEHFNAVIELYGGIVQANAYVADLEQTFKKQAEEIIQNIKTIDEKIEQLKEHAVELEEKLATIQVEKEPSYAKASEGMEKIVEEDLPEIKRTKQTKITTLNWYEKSIAASAIFVLTIRDFFRDIFDTAPAGKSEQAITPQAFSFTRTSTFEQQIDTKIKKLEGQKQAAEQAKVRWIQIEQEKASLLGQLSQKDIKITLPATQKPLPQESVGQLVRRIFFATTALIKKATNPVRVFVINILVKAGIMQEPIEETKISAPEEVELEAIEPQVEPEGVAVPLEEEESLELEIEPESELELKESEEELEEE